MAMKKKRKSKQTLFYDKRTNLISVNTNTNTANRFKLFLEQNKIYFETILAFILTITGIIVSIASVKVGIAANNIAEYENQINDLEKQPTFIVENETNENEEKYIIRNTGGDIQYGNLFCDKIFLIFVYDEDYDYFGCGYIILDGYMENRFSAYDFNTKSFTVSTKLTSRPILQWSEIIENIVTEEGYFCGIVCTEHLNIIYQNYKQELINRDMFVENGIVRDFYRDDEYRFKIYTNVNDLEEEQLKTDIKKQLELLQRYNN